ncbi:hypothetical protein ACNQO9_18490, partial [Acinetobacter calcoaceticus]
GIENAIYTYNNCIRIRRHQKSKMNCIFLKIKLIKVAKMPKKKPYISLFLQNSRKKRHSIEKG